MEREELRKQLMKLRRESIIQGFLETQPVNADAVFLAALKRELELEEKQHRKASENLTKLLPMTLATVSQITKIARGKAVERRYENSCERLRERINAKK
jgi:hypothetical protein